MTGGRRKKVLLDFQGGWGLGDLLCADPLPAGLVEQEGLPLEIRTRGKAGNLLHNPLVAGEAPPGWRPDRVVEIKLFNRMPLEEYARLEALPSLVDHLCAYGGVVPRERRPRLHLTGAEREIVSRFPLERVPGRPLAAVCTDFFDPYRHWPRERWIPVLEHLWKRGARIVEVGLQPALGAGMDLCGGRLPIRVAAAVLERCDLFLGHNTGTFHYAQAAGIPCVTLFSLALPQRFVHDGALVVPVQADLPCRNCMTRDMAARVREGCPLDPPGACMRAIPPGAVLQALDRIWEEFLLRRDREGRESGRARAFRWENLLLHARELERWGAPGRAAHFRDQAGRLAGKAPERADPPPRLLPSLAPGSPPSARAEGRSSWAPASQPL